MSHAALEKLAALLLRERLPFVARGSGKSLSGGSLPIANGVVIALKRINKIVRLDPAQRIAVVEPGAVNTQVSAAAAPHVLHYAPDPSSQTICTVGGNVAFNSGGAHCLKYGMIASRVLGLKAVLATGAEVVASGNIGCLTQLRMHPAKLGSRLPLRHTMQVLRDAYDPERKSNAT